VLLVGPLKRWLIRTAFSLNKWTSFIQ
jgi:hypothetical protein